MKSYITPHGHSYTDAEAKCLLGRFPSSTKRLLRRLEAGTVNRTVLEATIDAIRAMEAVTNNTPPISNAMADAMAVARIVDKAKGAGADFQTTDAFLFGQVDAKDAMKLNPPPIEATCHPLFIENDVIILELALFANARGREILAEKQWQDISSKYKAEIEFPSDWQETHVDADKVKRMIDRCVRSGCNVTLMRDTRKAVRS